MPDDLLGRLAPIGPAPVPDGPQDALAAPGPTRGPEPGDRVDLVFPDGERAVVAPAPDSEPAAPRLVPGSAPTLSAAERRIRRFRAQVKRNQEPHAAVQDAVTALKLDPKRYGMPLDHAEARAMADTLVRGFYEDVQGARARNERGNSVKSLVTSFGIVFDKRQLASMLPTAIVGVQDAESLRPGLLHLVNELASVTPLTPQHPGTRKRRKQNLGDVAESR